jgi:hypothetical protein
MNMATETTTKTTTRKPPAKKATVKKTTAKKTTTRRQKPAATPMPEGVRAAAAHALGAFEEKLLENENVGFNGANTRELKGNRVGMVKTVKFDVGNTKKRAIITVVYR